MAASALGSSSRRSLIMNRTAQWVISQDIPTDIVVKVGEASFPLHKFMLVAKSGLVRRKILEASKSDLTHVDLSEVPGGADAFERAAKFCYGVNFEITIHNVAALRCAAEYLEMTDKYCDGNLASRTEEFLSRAALNSLSSAVAVLTSCERLLPMADQLNIVQKCVDAVSSKAFNESKFPTRSPEEWWAYELATLGPSSLHKTLAAMRTRGAAPKALATAVCAYAEKLLPDILAGKAPPPPGPGGNDEARTRQRGFLQSVVSLLPEDVPFNAGFLCCLLRAAIFLESPLSCKKELEKRVSAALDQASVGDLLSVTLDYGGERVADVDSVRRVVAGFVEREGRGGVLYGGGRVLLGGDAEGGEDGGRVHRGDRHRRGAGRVQVRRHRRGDAQVGEALRRRSLPRRRHLPQGPPCAGRDREGEGVQRHGPPQALLRGPPPRLPEQTPPPPGHAPRPLLRPAQPPQWRRRRRQDPAGRRRRPPEADNGRLVADPAERVPPVGAHEDEAVRVRPAEEPGQLRQGRPPEAHLLLLRLQDAWQAQPLPPAGLQGHLSHQRWRRSGQAPEEEVLHLLDCSSSQGCAGGKYR